ncbi:very short patch repair endonuclease [Devosia sp. SL43]|uniref:very short patch repair endonuclease n=1 Tax=Devosia sp. SL43 TaxID=2806348 RepID=UPI001F00A1FB|nr:DNA mismatch endonuclease Vsr [Devosia sp. SL43]
MSTIRSKNTGPELKVRRLVHRLGFRYRLHRADLPGKPDLVFAGRRKVIFVHGCYWHRHDDPDCKLARLPKSRLEFWLPKLEGNRARDRKNETALAEKGWDILVLWECQVANSSFLEARIRAFLNDEIH